MKLPCFSSRESSLCSRAAPGRRGFTMLEVMVVTTLMAFLTLLLSATWAGLVRPTADLAARTRLSQEANLAAASLVRDLAGSLPNAEGRIGTKAQYRFVGRMQPFNNQLWLCFDGSSTPNGSADWGWPDTVIVYEVQDHRLVRWDQSTSTIHTLARHVQQLDVQDLGDRVQLKITFQYRGITPTYTLIARDP